MTTTREVQEYLKEVEKEKKRTIYPGQVSRRWPNRVRSSRVRMIPVKQYLADRLLRVT